MAKLSGNVENFTFKVEGSKANFGLAQIEGDEGMSLPFVYTLKLVSEDADIDFAQIIAKAGVVKFISEHDDVERYIHGMISHFALIDQGHRLTTYIATLVPQVWTLTQMADCRIFQKETTPNIIKKILKDAKIPSDTYKLDCKETYAARDYCVQYRETDWDFISRLMEEEGIFYYFEHRADKHLLVIADKSVVHQKIGKPAEVIYQKPSGAVADEDTVYPFNYAEGIRSGSVVLNDFMFRKPSLSLKQKSDYTLNPELEVYDYANRYPVTDEGTDAESTGKRLTQVRLEAAQVNRLRGSGKSDCMRFTVGYRFTLQKHERKALNQDYLLTHVSLSAEQPAVYEEGAGDKPSTYSNTFTCIPASVQYRSEQDKRKPSIPGAQTAIVTGLKGEEIYTDEFGRVKVQFHWDREGKNDEKSSCWLRVSQVWAGAGWGAMFIPRIGHEVIVEFLEGDPDRPIITGRVYHGTNKPPYPLPEDKTRSTIKSDSTKGGGGSNELRFEDLKDKEEIYLHGQKDWTIKIENDKNQVVGHDETLQVGNDRSKSVGHDQSEAIGNHKTITVGVNHTETIGANMTLSVGANQTETIALNCAETIGIAKELTIGGAYAVTVGAAMNTAVGLGQFEEVGLNKTTLVGKTYSIKATDEFSITVGKSSFVMKSDGSVVINGTKFNFEASGPVQISGKDVDVN